MRQILLHIGARKCGSTAIQKYFALRSEELSRLGVRYVQAGRMGAHSGDGHYAHHHAALIEKFADAKWDEIVSELRDAPEDVGVLSSEIFYSLPEGRIEYVRDRLAGYDVRVLLVVRDPLAFLKSEYKQQIKLAWEHRSFLEFATASIHLARFEAAADRWRQVFGPDSVTVLDVDVCRAEGPAALIERTLALCGLDSSLGPNSVARENISLRDRQAIALRSLNRLGKTTRVRQLKNSLRKGRPAGRAYALLAAPFLPRELIAHEEIEAVRAMIAMDDVSTTLPRGPVGATG